MIPKHAPAFTPADFAPYILRRYQPLDVKDIWGDQLPDREVFPTPTGRHALWYFLEHIQLPSGSEVLIAAYNFYIIVRLVIQKGLVPVFVDIDPDTLCMDVADLTRKVTDQSRLVIVTHMFGNPVDMTLIQAVCEDHKLLLFEDCAHAVGTLCAGKQVGQFGDGALFSFGIQKSINSFGGGLLTLSPELAETFQVPTHHVSTVTSLVDTFGRFLTTLFMAPAVYGLTLEPILSLSRQFNLKGLLAIFDPSKDNPDYRFTPDVRAPFKPFMLEMHRIQLGRHEQTIARRREHIHEMKTVLAAHADITLFEEDKYGRSNGSYFSIRVPDPDATADHLARHRIGSGPHEYYNCAALTQFKDYSADCPHSDKASRHTLRLPGYPTLRAEDKDKIVTVIIDTIHTSQRH